MIVLTLMFVILVVLTSAEYLLIIYSLFNVSRLLYSVSVACIFVRHTIVQLKPCLYLRLYVY